MELHSMEPALYSYNGNAIIVMFDPLEQDSYSVNTWKTIHLFIHWFIHLYLQCCISPTSI